MLVQKKIDINAPLTAEQKVELRALENHTITFDADCMPWPDELRTEMRRLRDKYKTRRITKEIWYSEHPDGSFSVVS